MKLLYQMTRVMPTPSSATTVRMKKDCQVVPLTSSKVSHCNPPSANNATNASQRQILRTNDTKSSVPSPTNPTHGKPLEMATRVTTNLAKQHASRLSLSESATSQVCSIY